MDNLENAEICAITTDGGTSSDATSFQDINVYYIDEDMQLNSHCLAVTENGNIAANITKAMLSILIWRRSK